MYFIINQRRNLIRYFVSESVSDNITSMIEGIRSKILLTGRNARIRLNSQPKSLLHDIELECTSLNSAHATSESAVNYINFSLEVKDFDFVLSVMKIDWMLYWSLIPAETDYTTYTTMNMQRDSAKDGAICRAYYKIEELFDRFVDLETVYSIKSMNPVSIDVGAAPGGWVQYLAEFSKLVYAIDPAELDATVSTLSNVVHLSCKAEEAVHMLAERTVEAGN